MSYKSHPWHTPAPSSTSTITKPPCTPHTPLASLPLPDQSHSRSARLPRSRPRQRNARALLRLASGCESKTGLPRQPTAQVDPPICNHLTTLPSEGPRCVRPVTQRETIYQARKHPNEPLVGHSSF